jgi:hypothetical protein
MTTFMDELLAEVEEKEQQRKLELDLLKADQLLMAVSKLESQMNEVNKLANDEIALIENYRNNELERIEKKRSWLLFNLEGFARQQCEANGSKSIRLPHGSLALRKGRDKVEIDNLEVFMKVAARHGLLRITPEKKDPDLQAISAWIKLHGGEIPIGVKFIPATINFYYSLNGDNHNGNE